MVLKNKKCMWLYVGSLFCIILSTFVAKWIAPSLDFIGYSLMRPFFQEIITCILWLCEIAIFHYIYKKVFRYSIFKSPTEKGYELEAKRLFVITVIVSAVIVLIGAQIRFQVKPLYDLGEKSMGYEIYYHLGNWGKNAIKSIWIVMMLKAAHDFGDELFCRVKMNENVRKLFPWVGILMVCTLGIADIFMGEYNLPLTYVCLYIVYDELYLLTERHMIKTILLVMFLILF